MPSSRPSGDIRITVRLTPEERLELEKRSAGKSLSEVIRASLFEGQATANSLAAPNEAVRNRNAALASILARLAQTDVFAALSALAAAASVGREAIDEEALRITTDARDTLADIRSLLMRALRTKER